MRAVRAMAVRTGMAMAAAALAIACLAGCDGGIEPPSTGTGEASRDQPTAESPGTTDPAGTDPATDDSGASACAPTGEDVPAEAATGPTADLDGDGRPDELWLADVDGSRLLGVRTASGAVFSTDFTSSAPQAASALGQVLGDGSAVVLLDTGRAVPLYAVIDCALVPTQNDQGEQYTFDKGFTGYGTGVGCEELDGGGLGLVGYLAEIDGQNATVTSTRIDIADAGATATNGEMTEATGLTSHDPLVKTASSVGCGDAELLAEPPA